MPVYCVGAQDPYLHSSNIKHCDYNELTGALRPYEGAETTPLHLFWGSITNNRKSTDGTPSTFNLLPSTS